MRTSGDVARGCGLCACGLGKCWAGVGPCGPCGPSATRVPVHARSLFEQGHGEITYKRKEGGVPGLAGNEAGAEAEKGGGWRDLVREDVAF